MVEMSDHEIGAVEARACGREMFMTSIYNMPEIIPGRYR
jgi:hypothetical protein